MTAHNRPLPELSNEEILRYSRHLILPEVGMEGQRKLKGARVAMIGTGGLGAPLGLYLAAAGIGKIGIVDFDVVDVTNLQRQVIHGTADVGRPKIDSAADRMKDINPYLEIEKYETALSSENALEILKDYDVVVDGTDNFPTRYLVNDACVLLGKPNAYGSIFRFEGQATVFHHDGGPCYRCLYPEPPPPGLVPSCAEGGVLGILPAVVGSIQATETVKLILGKGETLSGRLMLYDALNMKFRELKLRRNPECPVCGDNPTVTELIDYQQFCGIPQQEAAEQEQAKNVNEITPTELKAKLDAEEEVFVLDVRQQHEYDIARIDGTTLIPLDQLAHRVEELDATAHIVVHCKSGMRSAKAQKLLLEMGFSRVTNLRGIWARLEGPQRLVVAAVLLATVVGLGGVVWFAGQPSYEIVYTARNGDEIGRVQQALSQANVSYQMDDTGMSFMVERNKVGMANSAIAREGLTGTPEISLNTSSSFIEDAATKKWRLNNVSRAQAVDAILKLDGVVSVTVNGSKPDRMIAFRDRRDEAKPKATVVLGLRPGTPFETVAYGAASIAASQLMIPLQNIDVFSTVGGNRWSYNPDRNTGAGSSEFLNMQRDISDTRTRMAQARLDQLWPGKISVQVTVELDSTWEVRSEKVLPDEPLMKKEESTKDSTDGAAPSEDQTGSKSKNEKRTREYVTDIGERRTGKSMPDIKRMSVAVLYDKSLADAGDFDEQRLVKTVKAIVGWDPSRDSEEAFSTLVSTFAPPAEVEVAYGGPGFGEVALQYAPMVGQIIGVVIVVMFLRGLFKRSRRPAEEPEVEPEIPEEDLAPEEQQRRMRREIERSIANDPAALAKMLEAWLLEQKA